MCHLSLCSKFVLIWFRRPHSAYKRLFKENAPLIFFILMGSFARTLFSRTLLPWPILCFSGQILLARFSNTSFGWTLLGSNFGGLFLEQTFCRHFAAFPLMCHLFLCEDSQERVLKRSLRLAKAIRRKHSEVLHAQKYYIKFFTLLQVQLITIHFLFFYNQYSYRK